MSMEGRGGFLHEVKSDEKVSGTSCLWKVVVESLLVGTSDEIVSGTSCISKVVMVFFMEAHQTKL